MSDSKHVRAGPHGTAGAAGADAGIRAQRKAAARMEEPRAQAAGRADGAAGGRPDRSGNKAGRVVGRARVTSAR
ncbi:hypothetical protein ACFY8B_25275 [Streptomyces sp. NPDC012751]|uniref:hypothetical protein n=1 Tax=Streptomyces sp. NPDC012751 TaxID=3364846 RepID=UPI0036B9ABE2